MQAAAILFIVVVVGLNFYYQNLSSFALALCSFPVLLWLLLRKRPEKPTLQKHETAPPRQTTGE